VPFGNPVGRFVFALTDWMVLPLRKVLPAIARWDTASLVAAYLIELAQFGILWAVIGRRNRGVCRCWRCSGWCGWRSRR
jgi:YggT family protein